MSLAFAKKNVHISSAGMASHIQEAFLNKSEMCRSDRVVRRQSLTRATGHAPYAGFFPDIDDGVGGATLIGFQHASQLVHVEFQHPRL